MTETPEARDARADDNRLAPADEPSAFADADVDEVAEGDAEETQYDLRSMPEETNPVADDPGSQLNF
ncbi:hypothetical protein [Cellulomonas carbonis]|uniref:Uncharacterized protein n=1 Tax=Cellulomonas carbonis T26 TaxID=947969 RepID=A0A0A0BN55_9CELL|nr:hypothetical protein [Cellulomonas carbonis]KGM09391.1 hypothetical protein N868_02300 [Cellulomonas carbonis T26]GGC04642.1 hypothetical protein GCM10010972_17310 [Cellulomonas carbonis]